MWIRTRPVSLVSYAHLAHMACGSYFCGGDNPVSPFASSTNGWYLASANTSGRRGMTASSGIACDELSPATAALPCRPTPAAPR